MGSRRLHNWHCLTMPIVHLLVLRMGLRSLHNWHCLTMPIVHIRLVLRMGLRRLHNWHCLTMPIVHIWCPIYLGHKVVHNANCADNAFYAGVLQCHLFRQCQLWAWDTLFLKFNFHLVNFHFLHIWHCLWHYVSLKYAGIS